VPLAKDRPFESKQQRFRKTPKTELGVNSHYRHTERHGGGEAGKEEGGYIEFYDRNFTGVLDLLHQSAGAAEICRELSEVMEKGGRDFVQRVRRQKK